MPFLSQNERAVVFCSNLCIENGLDSNDSTVGSGNERIVFGHKISPYGS